VEERIAENLNKKLSNMEMFIRGECDETYFTDLLLKFLNQDSQTSGSLCDLDDVIRKMSQMTIEKHEPRVCAK
jgi:hypothetical protein